MMKSGALRRTATTGICMLMLAACAAPAPMTETDGKHAKNVILFIGDGMGVSTVTAMRILDGQLKGMSGEENALTFETFPNVALAKTYNTNQQVPDSAGTATAMMTGTKTKAGFINTSPAAELGDCASAQGQELPSLAQLAESRGMATGVVTTTRVTHATPATIYAQSPHRDWEADSDIPQREQNCHDIARQLIEFPHGDGVDVVMGGGRLKFLPRETHDPGYPDKQGHRHDGRDLTREWTARAPNAAYIWNREQFDALDTRTTGPVLALFHPSHLHYDRERGQSPHGEPSLAEMTEKALETLARNAEGYFLMVEGGRIDHSHHAGVAYHALHDGLAFNAAVERALELTNAEETLVIVTADHSHTFAIAGYPTRGNPILGKAVINDDRGNPKTEPALADDGKPYTAVGYYTANNAAGEGGRTDLTEIDTETPDYHQQSAVQFHSGRHGGEDVAIYAHGPGAERIRGVMEQNRIYDAIAASLGGVK